MPSEAIQLIQQVQASKEGRTQNKALALYETPLVTVDIVVFTIKNGNLKVLLSQRKKAPYEAMWAIPGGFIQMGETLEAAAERHLYEETHVKDIYLEQLSTFGNPNRDPRSRVITVAYYALVSSEKLQEQAKEIEWFNVHELPELAFDHKMIVTAGQKCLQNQLKDSNIAFQLLPQMFTLTELQRVYELILNKALDKRNFRKKILSLGILIDTNQTKMEGYHRPAQLYAFKEREKVLSYQL
jgi:8-oxo-dGTP diphosphatase